MLKDQKIKQNDKIALKNGLKFLKMKYKIGIL
jgi:hypothetical protein